MAGIVHVEIGKTGDEFFYIGSQMQGGEPLAPELVAPERMREMLPDEMGLVFLPTTIMNGISKARYTQIALRRLNSEVDVVAQGRSFLKRLTESWTGRARLGVVTDFRLQDLTQQEALFMFPSQQ